MKKTKNALKTKAVKTTERSLIKIADVFSILPCNGPWYEVKVPQKLQK